MQNKSDADFFIMHTQIIRSINACTTKKHIDNVMECWIKRMRREFGTRFIDHQNNLFIAWAIKEDSLNVLGRVISELPPNIFREVSDNTEKINDYIELNSFDIWMFGEMYATFNCYAEISAFELNLDQLIVSTKNNEYVDISKQEKEFLITEIKKRLELSASAKIERNIAEYIDNPKKYIKWHGSNS